MKQILRLGEKAALKELKKRYGYDLAVAKQQGYDPTDERFELETLATTDMNTKIANAIAEFAEIVGEDADMVSLIVSSLLINAGDMLAVAEIRFGKDHSEAMYRNGIKHLVAKKTKRVGEHHE